MRVILLILAAYAFVGWNDSNRTARSRRANTLHQGRRRLRPTRSRLNIPAEVCRKAVGKPNKVIEISLADLGYEQHVEAPSKPVSRIRAWWDKVARKVAEWSLRITG